VNSEPPFEICLAEKIDIRFWNCAHCLAEFYFLDVRFDDRAIKIESGNLVMLPLDFGARDFCIGKNC